VLHVRQRPLWRVYLQLGRVSNLPTVWTNCIAGVMLAGGSPSGVLFLTTLTGVSLVYVAGMFLNDAFDRDFDRQFRKERPIPAGEIDSRTVFAVGFGLLIAGEVLFLSGAFGLGAGADHAFAGLLLAAVVVYYDYRHKRDPLSPLIMALCRFMVYAVAATSVASGVPSRAVTGGLVLLAYLIGLTYIAKQENLRSLQRLWPLLFLAAPILYGWPAFVAWGAGTLAFVLLAGAIVYAVSRVAAGKFNVPRAVVTLIAGISLVDAVLVSNAQGASIWVWCALSGFVATLLLQRAVSGT
jgi:hypothetical protein